MKPRQKSDVAGKIRLSRRARKEDEESFGGYRIRLLEEIGRCGSITAAARAVGVSYKTAWDAVDAMNNASERALVLRAAGGRGGGGTTLTEEGKETLRMYRIFRAERGKFMERLEGRLGDVGRFHSFLRRVTMRVSARNILAGKVAEIRKGDVNSEVILHLKGGDTLCSVITNQSVDRLGLKPGVEAYGIVKASDVILGKDLEDAKISARNVLCGTAERIVHGPVNAEVAVTLRGGTVLTSVITEGSAKRLSVARGDSICALVKASNVILGVDD